MPLVWLGVGFPPAGRRRASNILLLPLATRTTKLIGHQGKHAGARGRRACVAWLGLPLLLQRRRPLLLLPWRPAFHHHQHHTIIIIERSVTRKMVVKGARKRAAARGRVGMGLGESGHCMLSRTYTLPSLPPSIPTHPYPGSPTQAIHHTPNNKHQGKSRRKTSKGKVLAVNAARGEGRGGSVCLCMCWPCMCSLTHTLPSSPSLPTSHRTQALHFLPFPKKLPLPYLVVLARRTRRRARGKKNDDDHHHHHQENDT